MEGKIVTGVRIAPRKNGDYMKGVKVTLAWDDQSQTSVVGNMFAAFSGDMRGRQVQVLVNGYPVGTVFVPISTPNGVATIPIETAVPATPVAQPTREEPVAPPEARKGRLSLWPFRRRPGQEPEPQKVEEGKDLGEVEQIPAPARKPVSVDETHAPGGPNSKKILWLIIGVIIIIVATVLLPRVNFVPSERLVEGITISSLKGLLIAAWLVFVILNIVNRAKNEQIEDIIGVVIAIIGWYLSSVFANPWAKGFCVAIGLGIGYGLGIGGKPDFSSMGILYKTVALAIYLFGLKFGGPVAISTMDPNTLVLILWVTGDLHALLDMSQLFQWIKKHQVREIAENVVFMVALIAAYAVLRYAFRAQPGLAIFSAGCTIGIIAELMEETYKNVDVHQMKGFWQRLGSFAQTHKMDGVLVGTGVITATALLFGFY